MTVPLPDSLRAALAGRYTLVRELGAGGMAIVYLAHDVRHDRPVALKVLREALSWEDAGLRAAPDNVSLMYTLGYVLAAVGQTERALPLLDRAAGSDEFFRVLPGLLAATLRGQPLTPLTPATRAMVRTDPHGSLFLADIHAASGDREQALDWLGNAIRLGVVCTRYMTERSPFLQPLRGDPGFERLVADARARAAGSHAC